MLEKFEQKLAIKSILGLFIASFLFFSGGIKIPYIDDLSSKYFKDSITKAGVAYATTRVVNATVSIIQESKLQLEPAGVGFSIAVGQVLDPINDMAERLSDILVMAITSLGVQKLIYEISVSVVPHLLAPLLGILSLLIWIRHKKIEYLQVVIVQVSLLLFIARLCLPLSSLANEYLYKSFFTTQIQKSSQALQIANIHTDKLTDISISLQKDNSFWEKVTNGTEAIKSKSKQFQKAFVYTMNNAGKIIENLLTLSFLYIGVFLIQVILLPVLCFWLLVKVVNIVFKR